MARGVQRRGTGPKFGVAIENPEGVGVRGLEFILKINILYMIYNDIIQYASTILY